MKVLIATGLYAPEIGGPATHVAALEKAFPSRGIEVVVLPFSRVRFLPKILRHVAYFFLVLTSLRGVSVVYALDPVSVGLPALCASRLMRKQFILRVAGDYAWEQAVARHDAKIFLDQFSVRLKEQKFKVRLLAHIERAVARRALRVIVPSVYLQKIVLLWGVSEERVVVVYTAFSPIVVRGERDVLRTTYGFQGTVITSVGRLVPWKGFRALIDAIAELSKEYPDIQCVIIGDGPDLSALQAHAKERRVSERVHFLGRLSKEQLAEALLASDIFVLNTAYEGFSHQLLEVMSLGIPIITTSVGGNIELITHGKDGLLVPYNNEKMLAQAIIRLLQHHDVGEALAREAKVRVQAFTTERMVEGVRAVLEGAS